MGRTVATIFWPVWWAFCGDPVRGEQGAAGWAWSGPGGLSSSFQSPLPPALSDKAVRVVLVAYAQGHPGKW